MNDDLETQTYLEALGLPPDAMEAEVTPTADPVEVDPGANTDPAGIIPAPAPNPIPDDIRRMAEDAMREYETAIGRVGGSIDKATGQAVFAAPTIEIEDDPITDEDDQYTIADKIRRQSLRDTAPIRISQMVSEAAIARGYDSDVSNYAKQMLTNLSATNPAAITHESVELALLCGIGSKSKLLISEAEKRGYEKAQSAYRGNAAAAAAGASEGGGEPAMARTASSVAPDDDMRALAAGWGISPEELAKEYAEMRKR